MVGHDALEVLVEQPLHQLSRGREGGLGVRVGVSAQEERRPVELGERAEQQGRFAGAERALDERQPRRAGATRLQLLGEPLEFSCPALHRSPAPAPAPGFSVIADPTRRTPR